MSKFFSVNPVEALPELILANSTADECTSQSSNYLSLTTIVSIWAMA